MRVSGFEGDQWWLEQCYNNGGMNLDAGIDFNNEGSRECRDKVKCRKSRKFDTDSEAFRV